jgi:hypothetical protein
VWQTLPSSPVDKENRCLTTSFNQWLPSVWSTAST